MTEQMADAGRAHGHSGVGHDTVSALYCFPDMATPATVARFAKATDEGLTEYEAIRIAAGSRGSAPLVSLHDPG